MRARIEVTVRLKLDTKDLSEESLNSYRLDMVDLKKQLIEHAEAMGSAFAIRGEVVLLDSEARCEVEVSE